MDLGEESKGKEPRRVHTYIPHQIPKSKIPKTHQDPLSRLSIAGLGIHAELLV
jgi:PIN domain nuclease of toxin-antitoxin system